MMSAPRSRSNGVERGSPDGEVVSGEIGNWDQSRKWEVIDIEGEEEEDGVGGVL